MLPGPWVGIGSGADAAVEVVAAADTLGLGEALDSKLGAADPLGPVGALLGVVGLGVDAEAGWTGSTAVTSRVGAERLSATQARLQNSAHTSMLARNRTREYRELSPVGDTRSA
jgi:hypothetical protein